MREPVLLLILLNFSVVGLLPRVFFRSDGVLNLRWWATALPFGIAPAFLCWAYWTELEPLTPASWGRVTDLVAVLLSVASIGLIFLTLGTHRIPIALWHQDNDAPVHLVTYGAYSRIRHPFYTSFIVAFLAAAVAFPSWVTVGTLGYSLALLTATAVREERRLAASEFGAEYRRYMGRTGRFAPRLRGAADAGSAPATPATAPPAAARRTPR